MILNNLEFNEISKYVEMFDYREFMRNKTFLITGSKGIIGSGIIKWLLYENQINGVNAHIIASTRNPAVEPSYIEAADNIEYIKFGKEDVECHGKQIDYIIHAAAPTSNMTFKTEPVESLRVILDGTEKMLKIARAHRSSMIYLSSEEVYGTPDINEAISEDYVGAVNSLSSRSCYPLGKKVAELLCRCYFEEYGVNVKIIRPTVILGLWQAYDSVKVEAEILRCIVENKNLFMKSDGLTRKCAIYSLDAVSAVFAVLFKGEGGEAYNATNPATFCSVKDRANMAFEEFNTNIKIEFAKKDISQKQGYLPKRSLLENILKIEALGWKPQADMSYIYKLEIERFKSKGEA